MQNTIINLNLFRKNIALLKSKVRKKMRHLFKTNPLILDRNVNIGLFYFNLKIM